LQCCDFTDEKLCTQRTGPSNRSIVDLATCTVAGRVKTGDSPWSGVRAARRE
jgi:hypothetical protein